MASRPGRSSLVKMRTSPFSILSSGLEKPLRCATAVDPDTVSETIRCGPTLNPAASISMIRLPGSWPEVETRAQAKVPDMGRPVTKRLSETAPVSCSAST